MFLSEKEDNSVYSTANNISWTSLKFDEPNNAKLDFLPNTIWP